MYTNVYQESHSPFRGSSLHRFSILIWVKLSHLTMSSIYTRLLILLVYMRNKTVRNKEGASRRQTGSPEGAEGVTALQCLSISAGESELEEEEKKKTTLTHQLCSKLPNPVIHLGCLSVRLKTVC